jgi:hypothetical protein
MLGIKKAFIVGFCVVLLAGCGQQFHGQWDYAGNGYRVF